VIRRGFWLAAGAVVGVAGYRRATRLARALTQKPAGSVQAARSAVSSVQGAAAGLVSAAGFARDVRDGMAEYFDLRRDQGARTLGSQSASARGSGDRSPAEHSSSRRGA
jgi:hypothetical protein